MTKYYDEAAKKRAREYYLENKERIRAYQAERMEHIKAKRREHYAENRETMLTKLYAYQRQNKEKHVLWMRKANQKHKQKLRDQVLNAYGARCACCGETENEFLTVERVGGWGAKHRREAGSKARGGCLYKAIIEAGFPKEFGVLCMQCNFATRGGRTCPHQRLEVKELIMGMAC